MLKIVIFLVVGAFVIGAAFTLLAVVLEWLGYILVHLFNFLGWVCRQLSKGIAWVKLRWKARVAEADAPAAAIPAPQEQVDVPTPQAEPPVAPVFEVIAPSDPESIETAQSEPAAEVSRVETPIETAQPEPKAEEKPIEPPLVALPGSVRPAGYKSEDAAIDAKLREAKPVRGTVDSLPEVSSPPVLSPKPQPPEIESLTDLQVSLVKTAGSSGDLVELFVKGKPVGGYSGKLSVNWVMHDWTSGSYVVRYVVGAGAPSRSEIISGHSLSVGAGWVDPQRFLSIDTKQLQAFAQGQTLVHLEVRLSRLTEDAAPVVVKEASFQLELNIPNPGHGKHRIDREECLKHVVLLLRHVIRLPAGAHGVTAGQLAACKTSIMCVKKLMTLREPSYLSLIDLTMKQLVAPRIEDMLRSQALLHSSFELRSKLVEEASYLVGLSPSPAGEAVIRLMAERLSVSLPD